MDAINRGSPGSSRPPSPTAPGVPPPAHQPRNEAAADALVGAAPAHARVNDAMAPGVAPPPPVAAPEAARVQALPPYVGAIELDVFNEHPRGALPGLPQGEATPSRARRMFDLFFGAKAPRPNTGSWLLNLLDRRVEIRKSPAFMLGQAALVLWDAFTSQSSGQRTADVVVGIFSQLVPASWLLSDSQLVRRIVAGSADVLSLAAYPVGTPLALISLALLEAGEEPLKRFIQLKLGRMDSALVAKNVMEVATAVGCMALGREIERVTHVHDWYYHLARKFLDTPADGCQMWLDPQAGVSLFLNCIDHSVPITVAFQCGTALGSCAAAAFGSINRTHTLPPAKDALSTTELADALEQLLQRNSSQLNETTSWVRAISRYQASSDTRVSAQATKMVQSLMGAPYLAAVANGTSISDKDLAETLAAVATRLENFDGSIDDAVNAYDDLNGVYSALGYRTSVSKALTRMANNEPLTQTVSNGAQFDVSTNASGAATFNYGLFFSPDQWGASAPCQPLVGNLAIQWAGGRVNGRRPAGLPQIANLSAFGYDPGVYFVSCDTGADIAISGPDDPHEPLRAIAQAVTDAWSAPELPPIGRTNCTELCYPFNGPPVPVGSNGCDDGTIITHCDEIRPDVPNSWNAWRANLTTALQAHNATAEQALDIAKSWDALRDYVANLFGNKTLPGSGK